MTLLARMAISNGIKERKYQANNLLTIIDAHEVARWNRNLQTELIKKEAKRYPSKTNYLHRGGRYELAFEFCN